MKSIQINLLNLLILFGISSALPSRIKSLNWFTNYIVDASDDVEYNSTIQTNATLAPRAPPQAISTTTATKPALTSINNDSCNTTAPTQQVNESTAPSQTETPLNFSTDSIVRVGVQSPPSRSDQRSSLQRLDANVESDSSQQTKAKRQLNDESAQRRQDNFGQATQQADGTGLVAMSGATSGLSNHRSHYGDASNHQNYPTEPYPSASYTHPLVRAPPSGGSAAGASSGTQTISQTLEALLNRDHHHAFNLTTDQSGQQRSHTANQSGGTQSPDSMVGATSFYGATNHRGVGGPSQTSASLRNRPSSNDDEAQKAYTNLLLHNYALPNISGGGSFQLATSGSELNIGTSSLDTGLIQNLTAGLFPMGKLTNETLLSLNELLSRTKHQASGDMHQPMTAGPIQQMLAPSNSSTFSNAYKPYPSSPGLSSSQFAPQLNPSPYQGASNYLEALLGDQRFGHMLDYLTAPNLKSPGLAAATVPPLSHFGFREPSSMARFQSPTANNRLASPNTQRQNYNPLLQFQANKNGASKHHDGQYQPSSKNSNVYNTYLPYKDAQTSNGNKPPVTNGQMLKMAATLYDNYLDQNYRQHQQQQPPGSDHSTNQHYQFVQQHQANNQNHLDKVVYHSTPFRPSIVSPPQVQTGTSGQNAQRPRTEADVRSVTHASLNQISGPDRATNQRLQHPKASSEGAKSESAGSGGGSSSSGNHNMMNNHNNLVKHDDDPAPNQSYNSIQQDQRMRPSATTNNNSTVKPASTDANAGQQQQQPVRQQAQKAPQESFSGPQLLLDLYENAIDSQIQEAIYSDHRQHFHHLEPLVGQSSNSGFVGQQAAASSNTNWPYDENVLASYEPTSPTGSVLSSGSGLRPSASTSSTYSSGPVALGHTPSLHHNYNQGNSLGAQQSLDPLASALQELPTFSASDLQPIVPGNGGGAPEVPYSLMPHATAFGSQSETSPSSSSSSSMATASEYPAGDNSNLAALASQLYGQLLLANNQQHNNNQHQFHVTSSPQTTLINQLLGDSGSSDHEMSPTGGAQHHFAGGDNRAPQLGATFQNSHSPSHSSGQSKPSAGLPAILTKLHSSQLSSILTGPFASLYANLPLRHKNTRPKYNQQSSPPREPTPQATSVTPMTTAFTRQQAAAWTAHRAANLLASSNTLTPLQAAILQAQLASSGFMQPAMDATLQADHSMNPSLSSEGPKFVSAPSQQQQQQQAGPFGLTSGLAGGGISPLVWRNILSPIIWARKQTLSGQSNMNNNLKPQNSNGSQASLQRRPSLPASSQATHRSPALASLALMSPLWGPPANVSNGLNGHQQQWASPFNQLMGSPSSSQVAALPLASLMTGSYEQPQDSVEQQRSRLKIKIVKIPVAFYDVGGDSSGSTTNPNGLQMLADSSSSSSISSATAAAVLPFHLQPAQTTSLLAGLACHHNPNHNYNLGSPFPTTNGAASSTMSFVGQPHPNFQQHHLRSNQQQQQQYSGSAQAPSSSSHSTPATSTSGDQTSRPLKDFTDINQPSDLQVSPTSSNNQQQSYRMKF